MSEYNNLNLLKNNHNIESEINRLKKISKDNCNIQVF